MLVSLREVGWGRVARITGVTVAVLFLVWLIGAYFVIGDPKVNRPTHADAIVVLGPPQANGRLAVARSLLDRHVSDTLVVSLNSPKQRQARDLCDHPPAGVIVTCFKPEPTTTRGEAEQLRRLASQHGWTSIVVVTSTYHISRARMIFKRCFSGRLYLVAARSGISFGRWAYEYLYQTGAYVKALVQRGC